MRTPRLPAVDWTEAPADLNGLVRFAERRNLGSARVPLHFNWPLAALVWQIPDAVCAVLSSWWWTEKPSETCRASYRNKLRNFASCWFYSSNVVFQITVKAIYVGSHIKLAILSSEEDSATKNVGWKRFKLSMITGNRLTRNQGTGICRKLFFCCCCLCLHNFLAQFASVLSQMVRYWHRLGRIEPNVCC